MAANAELESYSNNKSNSTVATAGFLNDCIALNIVLSITSIGFVIVHSDDKSESVKLNLAEP